MASLAQNMTTFPTYMASCWLLQVPRSLLLSMTPQTELTMTDDAVASLLLHYTSTREESTLKTPEEQHHKAHCVMCCKIPSWNETPAQKNLQAKIPPAPNPCPIKVLHGKCPGIHTDSLHSWEFPSGLWLQQEELCCPQPVPLRTALRGLGARAGWLCPALAGGCSPSPLCWGSCGGERHSWKGDGEQLEEQC